MFANNAKKRGFWSSKELLIKSHEGRCREVIHFRRRESWAITAVVLTERATSQKSTAGISASLSRDYLACQMSTEKGVSDQHWCEHSGKRRTIGEKARQAVDSEPSSVECFVGVFVGLFQ